MGNSRRLGVSSRGVLALYVGGLVPTQRVAGDGFEFGGVVAAEGDVESGPVGVPVVVDAKLEGGKQPAQDRLGQLRQPIVDDREGLEEVDSVGVVLLVGQRLQFLDPGVALPVEFLQASTALKRVSRAVWGGRRRGGPAAQARSYWPSRLGYS
jgi:hypothetical protein